METALTVFLVAATTWLFLRIACRSERTSLAGYGWLGLSAGLMVLARTDTVFILPPVLLFLVARERGWYRWISALAPGGLALLVVAPWAIWSLVSFGTVIQVSGVAVPEIERQVFLEEHGSSALTQLKHAWDVTNDEFFNQLPHLYFIPRGGPRIPLLLAAAGAVVVMLLAPFPPLRRQVTRQIGLLLVPTVGVVATLLFHAAIRWHLREWYFAPMALVGATFLGILVSYVHSVVRETHLGRGIDKQEHGSAASALSGGSSALGSWRRAAIAALYGAVVLALAVVYGPQQSERWVLHLPHRQNMLEAARWLADNTDSQARIGSFNAGIIGYFSDRTVINLDGAVNEEAYEARRDGRLLEYICSQEIRYLVDVELDAWVSAQCREDACLSFKLVTTIGRRLFYFGGGQVDIWESVPGEGTTSSRCAEIGNDNAKGPGSQAGASGGRPSDADASTGKHTMTKGAMVARPNEGPGKPFALGRGEGA